MPRLFSACDLWLMQKSAREKLALFALPLVLCAGVAFLVILPPIDTTLAQSKFAYDTQEKLANELESTLAQLEANSSQEELASTLAYKRQLLQSLQEKALSNTQLLQKLSHFGTNPKPKDAYLHISGTGDVDMLEDIIELLEAQHFVFIENLAINAPFASSLELSFDVLNLGETLHKLKEL